ncbi:MAG: penicillin-binding protein, partial [Oscillospiraceae bacterium]|nr:penicillin-binding protein [Oscillospiraceae bacterium]
GIELYENTGMRANAETKKELYSGTDAGWYGADVIQAAIGQSDNKFTPMQMASYTAAIANGGVRYRSTFLSRVVSWDYQDLIAEHEPEVMSTLEMSDEAKECVTTGMRLAATKGTGAQYLKDYPIAVACKSGTAQWGNMDSGSDHACFVLFAPADNPEIAISVYVEKGAQGGYLANVCIPILDAYFSASSRYETTMKENMAT